MRIQHNFLALAKASATHAVGREFKLGPSHYNRF